MLHSEYTRLWLRRERRQGRHLAKALRGRYQKTFTKPAHVLTGLRGESKGLLNSHNPYSRGRWFRAVAGRVCEHLGAEPARFVPKMPVYLLTVIDSKARVVPQGSAEYPDTGLSLRDISELYSRHLSGLNYIGMIDPALYVSTQRTHGLNRFVQFHVHALVWGTSPQGLDAVCGRIRGTTAATMGGVTPADARPVRHGDLLQVLWYITKMPRKQYQIWRRSSGRFRQEDRAINGVNAVRLLGFMQSTTLRHLALAGGEGRELLRLALLDVEESSDR